MRIYSGMDMSEDIQARVVGLVNPAKYAKKQAERQAKQTASAAKDAAEDAEDEEPDAPDNLISTTPATRPAPDWKDAPDGMAALFT